MMQTMLQPLSGQTFTPYMPGCMVSLVPAQKESSAGIYDYDANPGPSSSSAGNDEYADINALYLGSNRNILMAKDSGDDMGLDSPSSQKIDKPKGSGEFDLSLKDKSTSINIANFEVDDSLVFRGEHASFNVAGGTLDVGADLNVTNTSSVNVSFDIFEGEAVFSGEINRSVGIDLYRYSNENTDIKISTFNAGLSINSKAEWDDYTKIEVERLDFELGTSILSLDGSYKYQKSGEYYNFSITGKGTGGYGIYLRNEKLPIGFTTGDYDFETNFSINYSDYFRDLVTRWGGVSE